jgi:outer membrane lipoprotein-sorting protein
MNCLSDEQLASLALGEPDPAARAHVAHCPACAAALARLVETLDRVGPAHTGSDADHAAGRELLLAALAHEAIPGPIPRTWREVLTMRRVLLGVAATAAALGFVLVGWALMTPSLLAQTTEALRQVKSYQCRMQEVALQDGKEVVKETCRVFWAAPGSVRFDTLQDGKVVQVRILVRGKPGIEIDHKAETFQRLDPLHGPETPLEWINRLASFAGKADRELPERKFGTKSAKGFEIAITRLTPDLGDGSLRVWPDPQTKLPLLFELEMAPGIKVILDDFTWDAPTDKWFDIEPPARYKDETPVPPADDQTPKIVHALKVYAKYCDGKYPQVKAVYGDVTSQALFRAAGFGDPQRPPSEEDFAKPEYKECQAAKEGFGWINTIQRHNPDAAYNGLTVGPKDKDKILFRWKLPDGDYRVIYGDLRAETVKAARLKELEGK